jgi:hypothetical protein
MTIERFLPTDSDQVGAEYDPYNDPDAYYLSEDELHDDWYEFDDESEEEFDVEE